MSDNVCPKCGKPTTMSLGPYYVNDFCQCYTITDVVADLQSEIARLKAELEKAESERDEALLNAQCWNKDSDMWETQAEEWETYSRKALEQRDEARRWARKYYRLYLIERQNYLDTFMDGDEWDEV